MVLRYSLFPCFNSLTYFMRRLLLILLMMTTTAYGQSGLHSDMALRYLVREPEIKSARPPAVILLHGIGSDEADLFSLAGQFPPEYLVISARAPYSRPPGYAWFEATFAPDKTIVNEQQAEQSRQTIIEFINQVKKRYNVDEHRVYLCGFSQGAIMSYCVALTRPDLVLGIGILSGRLLEQVKPMIAPKDKLAKLKIFIGHGNADNVIKVQQARDADDYLKKCGLAPEYKEYNEGHAISREELADLIKWMKK